jgi:NAD(P)-dependent dehydrogenase (short-subunit alcohol dehydrogenase family)
MTDKQKIAVVTGANKGIGKHIARQLAQAGLLVFVGSRDRARGHAAVDELAEEGLSVRLLPLDVTDPVSVMKAAERLDHDRGHLDVLVNNAGITSGLEPASQVSVDDMRRTYETNVFGVITVTNALLPLLRKSPAARIVNVSSGLGSLSIMSDPTFAFADLCERPAPRRDQGERGVPRLPRDGSQPRTAKPRRRRPRGWSQDCRATCPHRRRRPEWRISQRHQGQIPLVKAGSSTG